MGRVDIITTTFGKALGGASGGCVSGKKEIIDMLRQRSRPYLFSNSLSPVIAGATLEVLNMLSETTELRDKLEENTSRFRKGIVEAGYTIVPGTHAIVPIMLGHLPNDAKLSQELANRLLDNGIYVIGFYYPVVPKGKSRIRVQISAAHTREHIDRALEVFAKVWKECKSMGLCK
jgi:glycine C-acetyltransferase